MLNRKGFTLVELLVAATIIGILAVFATSHYRGSAAEVRWTQAKAKADQLAYAIARARKDYPNLQFMGTSLLATASKNCTLHPGMSTTGRKVPEELIACNYLENLGWTDKYFAFYACNEETCPAPYSDFLAVVKVQPKAPLPNEYRNYQYYVHTSRQAVEVTE